MFKWKTLSLFPILHKLEKNLYCKTILFQQIQLDLCAVYFAWNLLRQELIPDPLVLYLKAGIYALGEGRKLNILHGILLPCSQGVGNNDRCNRQIDSVTPVTTILRFFLLHGATSVHYKNTNVKVFEISLRSLSVKF